MSKYTTNEFKPGLKILLDKEPFAIIENEFVKPGKGQAFNRVKLRNMKNGRVLDRTFRSGESVDGADVHERDLQYLYNDGENWHFMDPKTYEQYAVGAAIIGDNGRWLKGEEVCMVTLWNGAPLLVSPPPSVSLAISDTDPGTRGDTVTGGSKEATLETGAVIRVPLFVQIGEIVRVDTRTGDYQGREKE